MPIFSRSPASDKFDSIIQESADALAEAALSIRGGAPAAGNGTPRGDTDVPQEQAGFKLKRVDEDRLKDLQNLIALAEIRKRPYLSTRKRRWQITAGVCLTLLMALLIIRVPSSGVDLDIRASGVELTLPQDQPLFDHLRISELGMQYIRSVDLPQPDTLDDQTIKGDGSGLQVRISADEPGHGEITLNRLVAPARCDLIITGTDASRVSLEFASLTDNVPFEVAVSGRIRIVVTGTDTPVNRSLEFASPRIVAITGSPTTRVQITAAPGEALRLRPQIPVSSLAFTKIEEYYDGARIYPHRMSTIQSGQIYLESVGGKTVSIRPSEIIGFDRAQGTIRTLTIEPEAFRIVTPSTMGGAADLVPGGYSLTLRFHGTVHDITEESSGSLMPRILEWLAAQPNVTLFGSVFLAAAGFVATVSRLLRGEP